MQYKLVIVARIFGTLVPCCHGLYATAAQAGAAVDFLCAPGLHPSVVSLAVYPYLPATPYRPALAGAATVLVYGPAGR